MMWTFLRIVLVKHVVFSLSVPKLYLLRGRLTLDAVKKSDSHLSCSTYCIQP
jgi:hypothetical protein